MSKDTEIDAKELKKLLINLGLVEEKVRKRIVTQAVKVSAINIRDEVRRQAPQDKGFLKDSIIASRPTNKQAGILGLIKKGINFSIGISNKTKAKYYANIQEFGSRFVAANPFFSPAFDKEAPHTLKIVKDALRLKINKIINTEVAK